MCISLVGFVENLCLSMKWGKNKRKQNVEPNDVSYLQ